VFAIGVPIGPVGGAPGAADGAAPSPPVAPGNAEETWLNAGAAEAQPWGTDNAPSVAALPIFAVTAVSPIPVEPNAPAPEPRPGFSADPNTWNPSPKALVVGPIEFITEAAEPSIDAGDAIPDTRLVPDVTAVDDVLRAVNVDNGDVDDVDDVTETADASPCTPAGIAAELSGVDNIELSGVDSAEVSCDTTCTPVPADVVAACVTAAANPANPLGWVVATGVANGVNVDAAAAAPA
jgi:hypothetical protein